MFRDYTLLTLATKLRLHHRKSVVIPVGALGVPQMTAELEKECYPVEARQLSLRPKSRILGIMLGRDPVDLAERMLARVRLHATPCGRCSPRDGQSLLRMAKPSEALIGQWHRLQRALLGGSAPWADMGALKITSNAYMRDRVVCALLHTLDTTSVLQLCAAVGCED